MYPFSENYPLKANFIFYLWENTWIHPVDLSKWNSFNPSNLSSAAIFLFFFLKGRAKDHISHNVILSIMLPVWIKIDAASDKSLIINSPFSLLSRIIWTKTNFLSLWTTLRGYYPAVQLSGKITIFILLICNDVMHPSPGSRWLWNNGIVQLQGWQTIVQHLSVIHWTPASHEGKVKDIVKWALILPLEWSLHFLARGASALTLKQQYRHWEESRAETVSEPQPGQCQWVSCFSLCLESRVI